MRFQMSQTRNLGLAEIPPAHREELAELIRVHGIAEVVRMSGLGRAALLSVVAQGAASRGTAALVREFAARRAGGVTA